MEPFSVAAVQAQCTALISRIHSVKASLDDLVAECSTTEAPYLADLCSVSTTAHELGLSVDQTLQILNGANVISPRVQQQLPRTLTLCEEVTMTVTSEVKRFTASSNPRSITQEKLPACEELIQSLITSLAVATEVLNMQDRADQDALLNRGELLDLFTETERLASDLRNTVQANPPDVAAASSKPSELPDYETAIATSPQQLEPEHVMFDTMPAVQRAEAKAEADALKPPSPKKRGFSGFIKNISSIAFTHRVEPLVSPLCHAAMIGNTHQVEGLLSEGANIEGLNENGRTALVCAILAGQTSAAQLLLDKGAKLTTRDCDKKLPPLFHAIERENALLVELLLVKGADPNAKAQFGQPYLVGTMKSASADILRLMFKHGANPNTTSMSGKPIVVRPVQDGNVELTRLLLESGADIKSRHPAGHVLIGIAVENEDVDMVRLLVDRGADVNARTITGEPMAAVALAKNNLELLRFLLESGGDVNARDTAGNTMILRAVVQDKKDFVQLLLDHGADLDVQDHTGQRLVLIVLQKQRLDTARQLLQHGASADVQDAATAQPLLLLALKLSLHPDQRADLVRLMLQNGADPNKAWATAAAAAATSGPAGIANAPLGYCVETGDLETARLLLEHGADPNRTVPGSQTLLWFAVHHGRLETAQLLLGYGADPDVCDASGGAPLSLAVQTANLDMVRLLLRHSAKVTSGPASPLDLARELQRTDIVKTLEKSLRSPGELPAYSAVSPRSPVVRDQKRRQ